MEADEAIRVAKVKFPELNAAGMTTQEGLDDFNLEQVATAIAFLRQARAVKRPNNGSYYLKHVAEQWGRRHGMAPYIANGELIVAAVYLGFPIKHKPGYINVTIGVSDKDVAWNGRLTRA
jgi:hypothetical protein